MRTKAIFASVLSLSLLMGALAFAQMEPAVKTAKIGGQNVFVDSKGMTLYTYDRDTTPDKSVCNDRCAMVWPPFMAGAEAMTMGSWSVVTRDDGTKQWAYNGKPVYTYSKDAAPGDAKGDGLGPQGTHVWHVAKAP